MNMHCLLLSATFSLLFLFQRKARDKQPIKEKTLMVKVKVKGRDGKREKQLGAMPDYGTRHGEEDTSPQV